MRGATGSDPRGGNFLDRRLAHRGQCRSVALLPRVGVPMTDDDRFRLLFGPYRTPVFKYGDDAFCELRGEVILCGLTDAPIPWPTGKKRQKGPGARAIFVYGALAEAVRRESAQAVARWWGVTNQTHDARSCALLGCCGLPYSGGGGSPAVGAVVP